MAKLEPVEIRFDDVCLEVLKRAKEFARFGRKKSERSNGGGWKKYGAARVKIGRSEVSSEFDVLAPLIEKLFRHHPLAWCGVCIRRMPASGAARTSGPVLHLDYWARDNDVLRPEFLVQELAGYMARRQDLPSCQLLLTSTLCLNELDDGQLLQVYRQRPPEDSGTGWVLNAEPLMTHLDTVQRQLSDLFAAAVTTDDESEKEARINEAHQLVHSLASQLHESDFAAVLAGIDSNTGDAEHDRRAERLRFGVVESDVPDVSRGVKLVKYLGLMTAAWPAWQRITMIPNPASVGLNIQPGGLILCEDGEPSGWYSDYQLEDIAMIAGAGMSHIEVSNARTLGNLRNREAAMGLMSHEFKRRSKTIRQALKPDCSEMKLDQAHSALDRLTLINDACFHLMCGSAKPLSRGQLDEYLLADKDYVKSQWRCLKSEVTVDTAGLQRVDIRIYFIAAEILRNAGLHVCNPGTKLRSDEEPARISLRISRAVYGVDIYCESSPHELVIENPKRHFSPPEDKRQPSKGIPLIWRLADQLGGKPDWETVREGEQVRNGKKGRYRVVFHYSGPGELEE